MKRLGLCLLVLAAAAPAARAQIRPEAEKLFRDGKELVKVGKIAEACSAFDASEKAEHSIATLLSLADCRERNFQFASAWALFLQADRDTRGDAKQMALNKTAKARAAKLEPRLSFLTISVADESRVPDLIVTRDGVVIDPAEWNTALPIDGGMHEIAGKAPGHESWATRVQLKSEHDKQQVQVPKFKELPKAPHDPEGGPVAQTPTSAPPEPELFTMRRKIGLGVAGGGVVLAGVGVGFAINARSLRSDALATCPPGSCSMKSAADAQAMNDRARRRALVANVGFAAGAAAVITGAVLWFTGKPVAKLADEDVAIVPQLDGFAVVGSF